jgi:putative CocE/NonD family hydrolase
METRMTVRTDLPHPVTETEDLGIVMSDGVRLSARVWMPEDAGMNPVPAILEYIPYRKRDGTLPRDEMMHPYFAGHGYAAVRVDMRGNGDSEGLMSDEYTIQELADACEVIEWLAAQPWCSGKVGMMGKSWGGFNCLQTAFLQPPALKAVVSVCSTSDRFADDIHYKGGCLLGENFGWGAVMLSYSSRPPDPVLKADWRKIWLERLENEPWLAPRWAEFQERSDYWKHGSICEDWARNTAPIQIWGGWADNYMNTCAKIVDNVPGSKAIIGPWVHQYPHTAVPGPQVGFLDEALRWWDRWLKDIPNGAEADPAWRVWRMDSAPPDASAKARPGTWIAGGHGEGVTWQGLTLGTDLCQGAAPWHVASPQHLGMDAGEFFPMGLNAEMPGDQAGDDALSLCFDGPVLTAPLALVGAARLSLRLACDRELGFVVARLCDVAPDGSSVRIAHGMLNLCHRDSMESPARLTPGAEMEISFALDEMAYQLAPGHRLRLAISNAYWPFLWPSPEAGCLTIAAGRLDLPTHLASGGWTPPPAAHAKPWKHRVIRPGKTRRYVERDMIAGTRALIVEDDLGDTENLTHGLVTGETMSERWEIGADPLSAKAIHTWEQRLSRGDWAVRTEAWAEMTGTATHLRMKARLVAYEGDREVFRRDWDDEVERRFI